MRKSLLILILFFSSLAAKAHDYLNYEQLINEWYEVDFDSLEIRTEEIAEGLYVLFGFGGNALVSIGEQGTLMVDSQYAELIPKLREAINDLGGGDIDFTINTHGHFDHAYGNPVLGSEGTWIIAHSNARKMMVGERPVDLVQTAYLQPPYPSEALPIMTYDDAMQLHFNGDRIDLMHFGPAHTTGDTAVYFRNKNALHMGDVFNASFPFIDTGNGGDIDGVIHFCKNVLAVINQDTIVVPGHGPVMAYDDLAEFVIMLETIRDRIGRMIDAGYSLDEVITANPTDGFENRYGDPTRIVNRAYMSLSR